MIVVTTPTGSIGSRLVEQLAAAKEAVRVVARHPDKLGATLRERVEVVQGSSDDAGVLERALAGAESLFLVVPPFFGAPNVTAHYLRFTQAAISAMQASGVKRVVTVSGIGGADGDAGVVTSAQRKDVALERAGLDVRMLWCPGFMENMLRNLDSLKTQGAFFGPNRADVKAPYVAAADIAGTAARWLRDRTWSGAAGVGVLGPENLSLADMAAIMSEVLGRPIRYERVPADAYETQLLKYGASEDFASGFLRMVAAKDAGLDLTVARTPENTTPTHFRTWCRDVLEPALR